MLKNFLFGSSITNTPNVTVLGGRKPVQTLIINNTAVVGVDATANLRPKVRIEVAISNPVPMVLKITDHVQFAAV
jgi:hypothetical protein